MIGENQPIINLKEAKRWIVRLWFVSCFVFQIMKLFGYRCSQDVYKRQALPQAVHSRKSSNTSPARRYGFFLFM